MDEPLPLWWLSFVDVDAIETDQSKREPGGKGFLGVCIVQAHNEVAAVIRAWDLNINPGGEVGVMGPIPAGYYDPRYQDRLLTADEAKEL